VAADLPTRYEALRQWALTRPRPAVAPLGASVLLARGVAAWLGVILGVRPGPVPVPAIPLAVAPPPDAPVAPTALTLVLATLVAYAQEEVCV
jgi:hypothetical protein